MGENVLVDKLIRGKIIEIIVVILLVLGSIPVWESFESRISKAEVMTLDDFNLNFKINNYSDMEQLVISNDYSLNKDYKIFLKVNKNVDKENSYLKINGKTYNLEDFYKKNKKGYYIYTIISDNIIANTKTYLVEPILKGNNINYSYILEENNVF